jgi:hypothetical protein
VTVPTGFDPTKVAVQVRTLHIFTGTGELEYQSFPRHDGFPGLDTALTKIFECRPDSGGRIRLGDQFRLPSGSARLYFTSLPDGFAYPDPKFVKRLDLKSGQADIQNLDL